MLPSAARPRSTKVEVCTPIEGMSSRTGADPRMIGPRSTGAAGATGALAVGVPGVAGAAAPAPVPDRVGPRRGGRGTGRRRSRSRGLGRALVPQPQRDHDPGDENQHDGGRRGEQSSATATVLGGLVHQLRARARRADQVPEPAATSRRPPPRASRPVLVGLEAPPAPVAAPPDGAASSEPQIGRVGRLGRQARVEVALLRAVVLAVVVVVHAVDDDHGLALGDGVGHGRGDLDAAALVGDLAALGGVEPVDRQARLGAGVAGLGQRHDDVAVGGTALGGVELTVLVGVVTGARALVPGGGREVDVGRVRGVGQQAHRRHGHVDRGAAHLDHGRAAGIHAVEGDRLEVRHHVAVGRHRGAGADERQEHGGSEGDGGERLCCAHGTVSNPGAGAPWVPSAAWYPWFDAVRDPDWCGGDISCRNRPRAVGRHRRRRRGDVPGARGEGVLTGSGVGVRGGR